MSARPLLHLVGGLLERTYRIESGLGDLGRYIVGDMGYRTIYSGRPQHRSVGTTADGARMLVRETEQVLHLRVYFPDALIERLERYPPQRGIHEGNVCDFAVFVEEIDHLLLIAERQREHRAVSLFELELHANVSKQLVLERFLAGPRSALDPASRRWLRAHLFDSELTPATGCAIERRYRDAARYAVRLTDGLRTLPAERRLGALRRFHAADCPGKLEMISRL